VSKWVRRRRRMTGTRSKKFHKNGNEKIK
jgi:hypothetical protein